jgi:hypothetical protein
MPAPELQLFLRNNYSAELKQVPRSYFSEVKGDTYIKVLALEEDKTIALAASGKYESLHKKSAFPEPSHQVLDSRGGRWSS